MISIKKLLDEATHDGGVKSNEVPPEISKMKDYLEKQYNRRFWIRTANGADAMESDGVYIVTDKPNSEMWNPQKFKYHKATGLEDSMFVVMLKNGRITRGHRWKYVDGKMMELDMNGDEDTTTRKFAEDLKQFYNK